MNEQLFDLPETLSPRLAWMQKHDIATEANCKDVHGQTVPWLAHQRLRAEASGSTETEALQKLATCLRIPLWNEPPSAPPSGER